MRTELDAQQVAAYRRDGFLLYPRLLDAAEVAELKTAVLAAIATLGRRKVASDGAALVEGDAYYDRVFTQRLNLWRISATVRDDLQRPALGRLLCDLEGIDAIRVWHDQALIKEPFANPTALHLDNPYWSFHSRQALSIWIALGDLLHVYPEMRGLNPVVAAMRAGDCSFHNGLTAHGAGVNMTAGRRIAMTCAYMPDGSRFNGQQNVLPDSYVRRLAVGDLIDDDSFVPMVYRPVAEGTT